MRVGILGAAEARLDGSAIDLGTRKQRALLAALAMNRGRPVLPDTIVDLLWQDSPPTAVTATLQGYVARLRRALEPERPPRAPSEVLVTQQAGYALLLPDDALDASRFESVVSAAHQQLGAGVTPDGPGTQVLETLFNDLSSALGLWRGMPYTELEDAPAAQAERARLEELRAIALEDRAVAALGLGRHAMVAGELEVLTATYPLRERLWGLRALALTRSGRQADALEQPGLRVGSAARSTRAPGPDAAPLVGSWPPALSAGMARGRRGRGGRPPGLRVRRGLRAAVLRRGRAGAGPGRDARGRVHRAGGAGQGTPADGGLVSLASEIYYSSTHLEREVLCLEAVAMARRIGDRPLLLWSLLAMSLGVWRPGTARLRLETNAEAEELARELGAGVGLSTALTLQASAASELGLMDEMDELVARAREQASGERHLYALLVLDGLEIPWEAMRGNFERVDALIADMSSIHERTSVPQSGDALMGAILMQIMWGRHVDELRSVVPELGRVTVMPVDASMAGLLCRIGEIDEARSYLEARFIDLSPHWWFSTMESAMAAEAALHTGLRDLAADAYAALSEFSGQPACAGSGTALGPVDAYLAMAAEATGERDLATRHADDAARLCEEWRIPLAGQWWADVREKFGF